MTNEEICESLKTNQEDASGLLLQLFRQNRGFIYQTATRWTRAFSNRPDVDIEDLTQAAFIAVVDAAERYQADKGTKYITVLSTALKTAFSEVYGVRTKKRDPLNNAASLDKPLNDDTDDTALDLLPDADSAEPFEAVEEAVFNRQLHDLIIKALDTISEKQAAAVRRYYLDGEEQKDIAAKMGCRPQNVQALTREGLRNIRKSRFINELSEAYYQEKNLFRHTGYQAWKTSGLSQPEYFTEVKERYASRNIKDFAAL